MGRVIGNQGTNKGCGSSADGVIGCGVIGMKGTIKRGHPLSNPLPHSFGDGVMGRVIRPKGTDKGCGFSWDGLIGMKGTSKGYGSCGDGVLGCGIALHQWCICISGLAVGDGVTGQMSRSFEGQIPQIVHNNKFCNGTIL